MHHLAVKLKYRPLACVLTDAEPLALTRVHLILFDTYRHARHDFWQATEDVGRLYSSGYNIKVSMADLTLTLPQGGRIIFNAIHGIDDLRKFAGMEFGTVDASRCGPQHAIMAILRPRIYRSN